MNSQSDSELDINSSVTIDRVDKKARKTNEQRQGVKTSALSKQIQDQNRTDFRSNAQQARRNANAEPWNPNLVYSHIPMVVEDDATIFNRLSEEMRMPIRLDTKYRSMKPFEGPNLSEKISVKEINQMFEQGGIIMEQTRQQKILADISTLTSQRKDNFEISCEWICMPVNSIEQQVDFQE